MACNENHTLGENRSKLSHNEKNLFFKICFLIKHVNINRLNKQREICHNDNLPRNFANMSTKTLQSLNPVVVCKTFGSTLEYAKCFDLLLYDAQIVLLEHILIPNSSLSCANPKLSHVVIGQKIVGKSSNLSTLLFKICLIVLDIFSAYTYHGVESLS